MPPEPIEQTFPLALTILSYIATAVLVAILILLLRINTKIGALSAKLSKTSRAAKLEDENTAPVPVEVPSGTHFEEFLNEDPERLKLAKKEQFKAYRAWRAEKGLNWSK